jgi:hypothetical protein
MRTARSVSVLVQPFRIEHPDAFGSFPAGDGQEPETLPLVWGANCTRREHTPLRIEPEEGKVTQNSSKTSSNNPWDVFQHDESRSHLSDNPADVGPYPSIVVSTELLTGDAERLAREARSDDVNASTPRCAVKGAHIVPDRSVIQLRRRHPRHENGRRVAIPFNVSQGSGIEPGVSEGQLESAVSGAEV